MSDTAVVDVRRLAAEVPATVPPFLIGGEPPRSKDDLHAVRIFLLADMEHVMEEPDNIKAREFLQYMFNKYVSGLMHERGLTRLEAILQACDDVEGMKEEARRNLQDLQTVRAARKQ
jgi:hypothetical protein